MISSCSKANGRPRCRPLFALLFSLGAGALLFTPVVSAQIVDLGTAANFGVLAATPSVTNTGPTRVTGAVGVSPALSIIGFPLGTATGGLEPGTGPAAAAQTDLSTALADSLLPAACTDLSGQDLGGLTLTPGVYCYAAAAQLTGNLRLDFLGNPAAAFLFRVRTALTTASASSVLAINTGGATCLPNVNFRIGSSATLGTGSQMAGNILAVTSITLTTGASLRGRALASTGAVTLDSNPAVGGCPIAAAVPGGPIPGVPGSGSGVESVPTLQEWNLILLALLLAGLGGWYARHKARRR